MLSDPRHFAFRVSQLTSYLVSVTLTHPLSYTLANLNDKNNSKDTTNSTDNSIYIDKMPQNYNIGTGQDWAPVNVGGGSSSGGGGKSKKTMTQRELTAAKQAGLVTTEQRYGAGGNKSAHSQGALSAKKLEEATDVGTIAKVDKSLSKAIMQARTAKKMTQKDLATAINEKPQVVAEYESGKAIPNGQIIAKLERKLGTKLPRPGKSKAPPKGGGAKSTGTSAAAGSKTGGGSSAASRAGVTRGGPPKRR